MKRSLLGRIWPNAAALVLALGFVFPVYWMFTTAFKPNGDIITEDPVWFPLNGTFEHFSTAVNAPNFWSLVGNSVTVTVLAVGLSLLIALCGSFAVARMRFKGRKGIILTFMVAQMAPWEVLEIGRAHV